MFCWLIRKQVPKNPGLSHHPRFQFSMRQQDIERNLARFPALCAGRAPEARQMSSPGRKLPDGRQISSENESSCVAGWLGIQKSKIRKFIPCGWAPFLHSSFLIPNSYFAFRGFRPFHFSAAPGARARASGFIPTGTSCSCMASRSTRTSRTSIGSPSRHTRPLRSPTSRCEPSSKW